ncbi:hypothetical protein ACJMK2_013098 [Sinanodonta woodiana]|uniref:RAMA domain-containing protein n=1 Tax=Sinanodonta woodiana TaxID=1069815 RepID=A0ABD3VC34_SINWO
MATHFLCFQDREQKIVARILKLHSELASSIENSKECPDSSAIGRMRKKLTCINDILMQLKEWHKSEFDELSQDVRTSNKSLDERFRLRTSIQNLRHRQKIVLELFYKQKQLNLALKSTEGRVTNSQDGDNLTSIEISKDSTKLENRNREEALFRAFRSDDADRLQPLHYTDTCMKISKPSKVGNEDASTISGSEFSYKRGKFSRPDFFSTVGTNAQSLTTASNKSLNQFWSGTTNERCTNYRKQDLCHRSKFETSVEPDISLSPQSSAKISSKAVVNVKDKDPISFQQTAGIKRKVPSEILENLFSKRTKNAEKSALDDPAGGKRINGTQQIDKDHSQTKLHISQKEQEDDDDLNYSSPLLISYNQLTKVGQNIPVNRIYATTRDDDKHDNVKGDDKTSEHGVGNDKQDDVKGDDKTSEHGVGNVKQDDVKGDDKPFEHGVGNDKQDVARGDTEFGSTKHNQNDVAFKYGNNSGSYFLVPQRSKMFHSPVFADSSVKNASISPSGTSMSSDVFVVKANELQRRIDKKIELARLCQIQGQRLNLESLGVKDSTMTEILSEKPSAAAGGLQEEEEEDNFNDNSLNSMFKSFDWPELNSSAVQGDTVLPRCKENNLWLSKNSTTLGVMPAPKSGLRKMCPSLKTLISAGKLMPGQDNLTLTSKGMTEIASLTSKGLIEKRDGVVFSTPVQWLSSALGGVKVSRKRAYQEVSYNGQQLFIICQEKNHQIHGSSGFAPKSDSSAKMTISCDGSQAVKSSSSTKYDISVTNSASPSHRKPQHSVILSSSVISTQPQTKSRPLSRPGMIKQANQLRPVDTRAAPQTRGFLSSAIAVQETKIPKSKPAKGKNVNTIVTSAKSRPSMLCTVPSKSLEADTILASQQKSEPQVSGLVDDERRQQKNGINNCSQTYPTILSDTEETDKDNNAAITNASITPVVDETTFSTSRSDSNMTKTSRTEEEFLADLLYQCKVKLIDNRELINDNDLPENFWTTDYAKLKIGQSLWSCVDVWN